ncbi:sialate O-acetylesterase [Flavihumibacter sp. UBA7668]|uniref:sialate O-acetylesterase n=1 Tax=Flavihumibacter sp. UBA7668 TaxID=1946542 RepID=UPI0025BB27C2|nr:sialate O-acetylesterase [Flavihumibacter sp. UBA7668]
MILQRSKPNPVWGKGNPKAEILLEFGNVKIETKVQEDSTWRLVLPALNVNTKPQKIILQSGNEMISRQNILIGDVWLCTGQSNMEWAFSRDEFAKDEKATTNQPLIRLYNTSFAGKYIYGVPYTDSILMRLQVDSFYSGSWMVCTDQTVQDMSAIAYYFAKEIVTNTGVPIGIINLAVGGAPIETFIDKAAIASHPDFKQKLEGNWLYNPALPEWIRERGRQNLEKRLSSPSSENFGPNHAYKPGFAFEAAIPRFSKLPIAGVLFYQGESNSLEENRVFEYGSLMQLLVKNYRDCWKNSKLPFYWVQLSSIDTLNYAARYWPVFRNLQRELLDSIPYSGMAVTSDIGNPRDVHPRNKRAVGKRLSAWALNQLYGKKSIVASGPLLHSVCIRGKKLIIRFDYTAGRLQASDGLNLRGFSLDGKTESPAILRKKKVIMNFSQLPTAVYYGWAPYSTGNLINKAGLPASTFKKQIRMQ